MQSILRAGTLCSSALKQTSGISNYHKLGIKNTFYNLAVHSPQPLEPLYNDTVTMKGTLPQDIYI